MCWRWWGFEFPLVGLPRLNVYKVSYLEGEPGREFAAPIEAHVAADGCGQAVERLYARVGRAIHSIFVKELGPLIIETTEQK